MLRPEDFDRPFVRLINNYANMSRVLDLIVFDLMNTHALLSGAIFMAVITGADGLGYDDINAKGTFLRHSSISLEQGYSAESCNTLWLVIRGHILRPCYRISLPSGVGASGFEHLAFISKRPCDSIRRIGHCYLEALGSLFRVASIVLLILEEMTRCYIEADITRPISFRALAWAQLSLWISQVPAVIAKGESTSHSYKANIRRYSTLAHSWASYQVATLFNDARAIAGGASIIKLIF